MIKTEQEEFWQGEFGKKYIKRNNSNMLLSANISFFSKIFSITKKIDSILEFGCNVGMNLRAIRTLLPEVQLTGIEINKIAADELKMWEGDVQVIEGSILDIELDTKFDLTLIKGVLIHINPERLDDVYTRLYNFSSKYICIAEYYNPTPVTIPYRGHSDRLFKRDFAGELMSKYPDLELVDYGFLYHKDPIFPQGDITWFLMKKIQ
jgi:spore coat polysaccharide biosynthesis protein SpsF